MSHESVWSCLFAGSVGVSGSESESKVRVNVVKWQWSGK
jgi:hypothetical protein